LCPFPLVLSHQLMMPGLVLSPLHFAQFHQSLSFINLDDSYCNTTDMAYGNYSSDDILWQGYIVINIIPFNLSAILIQNQIHMRYTLDYTIIPHHPPNASRSLCKSNLMDRFTFGCGGTNPHWFP